MSPPDVLPLTKTYGDKGVYVRLDLVREMCIEPTFATREYMLEVIESKFLLAENEESETTIPEPKSYSTKEAKE